MSTSITTPRERENAMLRTRIAQLETVLDRPAPPGESAELAAIHSRLDPVCAHLGERASLPRAAESADAYRQRLLGRLQPHSPQWRGARLDTLAGSVLDLAEQQIRADAQAAPPKPGVLIPITTQEARGEVTTYHGDPLAWMTPFMRTGNVCSFKDERF